MVEVFYSISFLANERPFMNIRILQKRTAFICAVSLGLSSILHTVALASPFDPVAGPLLATYVVKPKPQLAEGEKPTVNNLTELLPGTAEQVKIVLDCFQKLPAQQSIDSTVIDPQFISKLELIKGDGSGNSSPSLLSHVDRTKTMAGRVQLAATIANPTHSRGLLINRQEVFNELLSDNGKLMHQLGKLLDIAARTEPHLLSYFQEIPTATHELIGQVYFGNLLGGLNNKPWVLEARTRLGNFSDLYSFFYIPALATTLVAGFNNFHKYLFSFAGKMIEARAKKETADLTSAAQETALKNIPKMNLPVKDNALLGDYLKEAYSSAKTNSEMINNLNATTWSDPWKCGLQKTWNTLSTMYNPFPLAYKESVPQTSNDILG